MSNDTPEVVTKRVSPEGVDTNVALEKISEQTTVGNATEYVAENVGIKNARANDVDTFGAEDVVPGDDSTHAATENDPDIASTKNLTPKNAHEIVVPKNDPGPVVDETTLENASSGDSSENNDQAGKRDVDANPYVFQPNPKLDRSQLLSQYKDELNRHWAWEDFHNGLDIDKFVAEAVSNDVQQAYRVLEIHLSFLASQLQAQTLAHLCDAEITAEGRAFYGVHIARVYLHIEVFGGLVNDLSDRFEREGITPGVKEDNPALEIAYKYQELRKRFDKPLEEHELAIHTMVFNYIFNLGAVAVLRALRTRIDEDCLDVWMTIHGDMLSIVRRNRAAISNCKAADIELMYTAFDIETASTLELLDGVMRVDTKSFMDDMFGALLFPSAPATA